MDVSDNLWQLAHLWPEALIDSTCGRRKSHGRSGWMNGATKPPAAASTWMGTSQPFSSFSLTVRTTQDLSRLDGAAVRFQSRFILLWFDLARPTQRG